MRSQERELMIADDNIVKHSDIFLLLTAARFVSNLIHESLLATAKVRGNVAELSHVHFECKTPFIRQLAHELCNDADISVVVHNVQRFH